VQELAVVTVSAVSAGEVAADLLAFRGRLATARTRTRARARGCTRTSTRAGALVGNMREAAVVAELTLAGVAEGKANLVVAGLAAACGLVAMQIATTVPKATHASGLELEAIQAADILGGLGIASELGVVLVVVLLARSLASRRLGGLRVVHDIQIMAVATRIAILALMLVSELIADLSLFPAAGAGLLSIMEEATVGPIQAISLAKLKALLRRNRHRG